MSNRVTFQLELMQHDHVMRESFQKIQDFLCSQNNNSIDELIKETITIINEEDVTPSLTLKNVLCDAAVYKKAIVRVEGNKCFNAQANNFSNSRATGVCVNKATPTLADVVLTGQTDEIFAGLDTTLDYYLSPTVAGGITTTVPSTIGNVIQKVGRAGSATKMNVNIMLSAIV